jgi:hypothetical protein
LDAWCPVPIRCRSCESPLIPPMHLRGHYSAPVFDGPEPEPTDSWRYPLFDSRKPPDLNMSHCINAIR